MKFVRALAVLGLTCIAFGADAQSFNIDLDVGFGPPEGGNGAPASSFGAAAAQTGYWSRVSASRGGASVLFNINGAPTSVAFDPSAHGGGAGSGMGNNTGDHRLLLNDGTVVTIPCTFTFAGLQPGRYQLYSYVLSRASEFLAPARITVPGATVPVQLSGQNYRPPNQFVRGTTHSVHDVWLSGSTLAVSVENLSANDTTATGFQLVHVSVPEPSMSIAVTLSMVALLRFRRNGPVLL